MYKCITEVNGFRKNDCVMECRGVEGGGGAVWRLGQRRYFWVVLCLLWSDFFFNGQQRFYPNLTKTDSYGSNSIRWIFFVFLCILFPKLKINLKELDLSQSRRTWPDVEDILQTSTEKEFSEGNTNHCWEDVGCVEEELCSFNNLIIIFVFLIVLELLN